MSITSGFGASVLYTDMFSCHVLRIHISTGCVYVCLGVSPDQTHVVRSALLNVGINKKASGAAVGRREKWSNLLLSWNQWDEAERRGLRWGGGASSEPEASRLAPFSDRCAGFTLNGKGCLGLFLSLICLISRVMFYQTWKLPNH